MRFEFPVDQILRGAAHSDGSLQSAVGIRLSDGAGELVFPHQAADLLHVHSDTHCLLYTSLITVISNRHIGLWGAVIVRQIWVGLKLRP